MSMPAKVKPHAMLSLLPRSTPTNGGSPPPMTFHPGRHQMHEVAQRRHLDAAVRIVRDDGNAGWRELAADHPVVAAVHVLQFGHQARRLPGGTSRGTAPRSRATAACRVRTDRRRPSAAASRSSVISSGRDPRALSGRHTDPGPPSCWPPAPELLHVQRELNLVEPGAARAVDAEFRPAKRQCLRGPWLRLDAGELELHRQVVGVLRRRR